MTAQQRITAPNEAAVTPNCRGAGFNYGCAYSRYRRAEVPSKAARTSKGFQRRLAAATYYGERGAWLQVNYFHASPGNDRVGLLLVHRNGQPKRPGVAPRLATLYR